MKNLVGNLFFVWGLMMLLGCSNDDNEIVADNQNPKVFQATVSGIFGTVATVNWEAAKDPDGDAITYSVWLEGEEILGQLSALSFEFTGLLPKTGYAGKVIAEDGKGGSRESTFAFNTSYLTIVWEHTMGGSGFEGANAIQKTRDGGFIVAGNSRSADGDVGMALGLSDFWIIKFDASGNVQWKKVLGGSATDRTLDIKETSDGGYIVAGFSDSSDGDVAQNYDEYDYWLTKLDNSGNLEWESNLGGSSVDEAHAVQQTNDGGFIVVGFSSSEDHNVSLNHGNSDCWIAKLDNGGSLVWETSIGGSDHDRAVDVSQTAVGDYLILASTSSIDGDVSHNKGAIDFWCFKLNGFGEMIWEKTFGGADDDQPTSMQATEDGFMLAGYSNSIGGDVGGNQGNNDFWVMRLDEANNIIWEQNFGGSGDDVALCILQTLDKGFVVVGNSDSEDGDGTENNGSRDFWIIKITDSGDLVWETNLGGTEYESATGIVQSDDGGFVVIGTTRSNDIDVSDNNGLTDGWIVKLK